MKAEEKHTALYKKILKILTANFYPLGEKDDDAQCAEMLAKYFKEYASEQCQKRDELIKAINDHVTFLTKCLDDRFIFLDVHCIKASDEEVEKGQKLRTKIEQLKSEISNEKI